MLQNLFAVILVGGFPVLYSYFLLSRESPDTLEILTSNLQGKIWYTWLVSMGLTVISYLVVSYTFIWSDATIYGIASSDFEPYLCATYALFLASASHWSYHILLDICNSQKSIWHQVNLYATGCFSIMICIFAFGLDDIDDTLALCTQISSVILTLHHVFFDAGYYGYTWRPIYSSVDNVIIP